MSRPADATGADDLPERVRAWIAGDPDPDDRAELTALLDRCAAGDAAATAELTDRFAGPLAFGTAGLRGRIAAGPNRMNRAVVMRASAGLASYLTRRHDNPAVVLGHDARYLSAPFADDAALVLGGAGVRVLRLPPHLPTPVLAFAVRRLGADAGVMVTASHNPAADNGYKVYLADGAQLTAPDDAEIAEAIAVAPAAKTIARARAERVVSAEIVAAYLDRAVGLLDPTGPRELRVVHTALHGVAAETFRHAWRRAGFDDLLEVAEQAAPDSTFPTVAFPNPEEPGALDLALAQAEAAKADLVLAHDPDGDRCAVAVAGLDGWRRLTGDEVGLLLAEHQFLMRRIPTSATLATTVVSGPGLTALATAHGRRCVRTPTGFKWLARVPGIAYAYEEALGYCVDPEAVRDKDGITAALLLAEMAALSRVHGLRLTDRLDAIARRDGLHLTAARSVPLTGSAACVLADLRRDPPVELGGRRVAVGALVAEGFAPIDAVVLTTDRLRAILRPSGTEPKLKLYLHASLSPPLTDLPASRAALDARLVAAGEELAAYLGGPCA
ncbi:MAG: phospho-sugar mutase [Sporichthyaceae bacterium]